MLIYAKPVFHSNLIQNHERLRQIWKERRREPDVAMMFDVVFFAGRRRKEETIGAVIMEFVCC